MLSLKSPLHSETCNSSETTNDETDPYIFSDQIAKSRWLLPVVGSSHDVLLQQKQQPVVFWLWLSWPGTVSKLKEWEINGFNIEIYYK